MTTERVLLIGMMGVGKTTVGRLLADRVGADYIDNDDLVRRRSGRGVAEILEQSGEPALREAERSAFVEALAVPGRTVIGVPGGMVLDPADRALVADAGSPVVWLRARPETIAKRVEGTDRPWLGDDPLASLTRLAADRHPLYAEAAHVVVDVDHLTPEQAAETAARLLGAGADGPGAAATTAADTMGFHDRTGGV